ncbi:MAG: hypothetical protein AAB821_03190 [Patescibacteria group bacterium]
MLRKKSLVIISGVIVLVIFVLGVNIYLLKAKEKDDLNIDKKVAYIRSVFKTTDGYKLVVDFLPSISSTTCVNLDQCSKNGNTDNSLVSYKINWGLRVQQITDDGKLESQRYSPWALRRLLDNKAEIQNIPFVVNIYNDEVISLEEVYDSEI